MESLPLIEVRAVGKRFTPPDDIGQALARRLGFARQKTVVHAVEGVSFVIYPGEVVGLVGESGCGKSTLGRLIAGVLNPSEGSILYRGKERGNDIRTRLAVQMIYQDPFASLNPRLRVSKILSEAPRFHGLVSKVNVDSFVDDLLRQTGLDPSYKTRFPHQFSGGQRQRIAIARALAVKPEFIVCDEPVAALDVSVQAQILNLFVEMRKRLNLSYLFISHDISVVHHIADRVIVMYLGRVVESASVDKLFSKPNHPYTRSLLLEVPNIERRHSSFEPIKGEMPSPLDRPGGCHFHPRCSFAMPRCKVEAPVLKKISQGQLSACHLNG